MSGLSGGSLDQGEQVPLQGRVACCRDVVHGAEQHVGVPARQWVSGELPLQTDPATAERVGAAREQKVAELTNGTVPSGAPGKPGLKVTKPGAGTTDVDVIGGDGSYIAVGGPAKARNLAKFGEKCHILKYAAEQQGVRAQVYLEEGTPESALSLARKILGEGNVHTFTR